MSRVPCRALVVSVVVAAGVAGVIPTASAGAASAPGSASTEASSGGVRSPQRASVVELTDADGRRSSAAVAGLVGRQRVRHREALSDPGGTAVLTGPIVTGPFRVAGLTWDAGTELAPGIDIRMRVREDGAWSGWLATPGERAVDGRGRNGTVPFVTGGADAIQVRISGSPAELPAGLDLDVVHGGPGQTLTDSESAPKAQPQILVEPAVARQSAVVSSATAAAVPQPTIVSRAGWGADESLRKGWEATTAELRAAVVHHTAGTNSYTETQSPQIVRDIYYFHAVTQGWGDVGYNFLVDRFGTVFEGRYGSIASPAGQMRVGSHAQGYNTYSMGIAAMGDYSSVAADQRILDSMRDVIAWRFAGSTTLDMATQALFPANGFHPTDRYLPRIFGHRDVVATVCPGDDIEGRIPDLISAVNTALGVAPPPTPNQVPVADAGADRTVKVGSVVTLTGAGADADGDSLTYRWAQTDGSPTVALTGAGTASTSFTAPPVPAGRKSISLTFTLTVADGQGPTATDAVVVKVVRK